jgi:thiol-disulfide isomerase/thioredoxin
VTHDDQSDPPSQPDPASRPDDDAPAPGDRRRRRGPITLVLALAAAAALIYGARSLSAAAAPAAHDGVTQLGRVLPAAQRTVTPRLSGTTLTGARLDPAALRGHVVVVNFWGSWCTPCRAEAPDLARLSTQSAARGVRFVGVDIRDEQAAGLAFEHEFSITYPSVFDPADAAAAGFNP